MRYFLLFSVNIQRNITGEIMKRIISIVLLLFMVTALSSCKQKVKIPDREAHMNNQSTETYSEYNERLKKEKAEKISRIKNAQWKKNPEDYKLIAFTFDDAPYYSAATGNNTATIIDTLNKYEGAGTLFVVGKNMNTNGTALLSYAVDLGFELGNHTYSHGYLTSLDENSIKNEIVKVNEAVKEQLGVTVKYVRPGYGSVDDRVFKVTKELNMPVIWTDITGIADYSAETTAERIEEKVVLGAYDGAIVLLHGQIDNTAQAMEPICKKLYEQGYRFVTVSELFEYKGIKNVPCDRLINNSDF